MLIFYIKETFRIFKRSTITTVITITITSIAVFLSSLSVFLIFMSSDFSDKIKQNIEVNLYLKDSLPKSDIEKIKLTLEEKPFIKTVNFISKEQASQEFINEAGEDFRSVLDYNPLPNSFKVRFKSEMISENNFEQLVKELKKINGIDDIVYDYTVVVRILKILRSLRFGIYITSLLLILLSIYLVYSNNRMQYEANKTLYKTMKLVGAKLSTLKTPIILYSILIGLFSSLICFLINNLILNLLTILNINLKFSSNFGVIHIITFLSGITMAFLGSYFSFVKVSLKITENENISR